MNVEQSRVENIAITFVGADRIAFNISDISFVPDEMIVRSVIYKHDGTSQNAMALQWLDMPGQTPGIIAIFLDGSVLSPQTRFQIGAPVKGQYTFITIVNGAQAGIAAGNFLAQLEFIRYKRPAQTGRDNEAINVWTPVKDRVKY